MARNAAGRSRSMIVYNGYPLSVFVAVTLHSLVLAGLLYLQREDQQDILDLVRPPMVKALLVDENPQTRNEQLLEQQRLVRIEDQKAAERKRADDLAAETKRQEELAAEQKRKQDQAAEQKRQQELAAEQKRKQDQAAEQKRQQELAAEQKRQQELAVEQERQRELAAEQRRQQQADAAAQAAAAEVARTEGEQIMAYTAVIHDLVQRNWSRPPSARNGMEVVIRLQMVPTGDVLKVEIVRSSGDPAFDRAAETAVYKVGQFRELQGMPINLFNNNFRSLLLTFRPEDLLN